MKVAWLAMVWVGWAVARRPGAHWGWWLVCAAGVLTLLAGIPEYLMGIIGNFVTFQPFESGVGSATPSADPAQAVSYGLWDTISALRLWWGVVLNLLGTASLAAALLSGLRPAPEPVRTDPPATADDATATDGAEREPSVVDIAAS